MRNFKISIDLASIFIDLTKFNLKHFNSPFMLKFVEASDPDDACNEIVRQIITDILYSDNSIEARIICRMIRKFIRIDKIQSL
jgi:tRNA G10  N-methylase Trm11